MKQKNECVSDEGRCGPGQLSSGRDRKKRLTKTRSKSWSVQTAKRKQRNLFGQNFLTAKRIQQYRVLELFFFALTSWCCFARVGEHTTRVHQLFRLVQFARSCSTTCGARPTDATSPGCRLGCKTELSRSSTSSVQRWKTCVSSRSYEGGWGRRSDSPAEATEWSKKSFGNHISYK